MPPIPSVTEDIRDFGLGLTEPAVMTPVVYGVSSLGAHNVLEFYASQESLKDARGEGPAVEAAANILAKGGGPVGFLGADSTIAASNDAYAIATWGTPGSNGSITRSGGTTGPAISLAAGAPKVAGQFKAEIQTGGTLGTATFRWSLDNGATWIASGVVTAASVALGTTGVTVNFPAGSYVSAEAYAWTATGGGGYLSVSGTATLDAHLRIEILTGGARGTATFRYSCDAYSGDTLAERTYSETLTVPTGGTFAVPSLGVSIVFAASPNFVAGDFYEIDVRCAAWNATDLAAGFTGLAAATDPWRFFVAVTSKNTGDASAHATLAAALHSQLTTFASSSKYRRGMIPAGQDDAPSAVATAFASTVSARLLIPYGLVRRVTTKPFPGFGAPVTHSIDCFAARAAKSLPSTDLKRVKSGPLDEIVKIFRDEYLSPTGLDDLKISTLRTHDTVEGFYVTQGRLKSQSGSDFKLWPLGLCMDIACETVHAGMTLAIGQGIRWNADGTIDERDAIAIEEEIAPKLITQLVSPKNAEGFDGHVQEVRYTISRTYVGRPTGTIVGVVGIRPLGYVDFVKNILGFVTQLPAAA
jgi:hypothetical protein